jgi:hypothetical protein
MYKPLLIPLLSLVISNQSDSTCVKIEQVATCVKIEQVDLKSMMAEEVINGFFNGDTTAIPDHAYIFWD